MTEPELLFDMTEEQIERRAFVDVLQVAVGIAMLVIFGSFFWSVFL